MRTIQKKKSIYLILGIIVMGLLLTVFSSLARHPRVDGDPGIVSQDSHTADTFRENDENQKEVSGSTAAFSSIEDKDSRLDSRLRGNDTTGSISESQKSASKARITIAGENFEVALTDNMSVYDAMKILKEEGKITFEGKEYPALGFFVTKINSLEAGDGKNLFYYINGIEASVGISTYEIKEGDIIEWKLK